MKESQLVTIDNLLLVSGPWQLILAAAALQAKRRSRERNVVFVLSRGRQRSLVEPVVELAGRILPAAKCVVMPHNAFAEGKRDWPIPFESLQGHVAQMFGGHLPHVKRLWVAYLSAYEERLLAEVFSSSALAVYEDGFGTYFQFEDEPPEISRQFSRVARWRSVLKGTWRLEAISHRLHTWTMPPIYRRRLAEAWLLLGEYLPVPPFLAGRVRPIPYADLLEQFKGVRQAENWSLPVTGAGQVLCLGQNLYMFGMASVAVELALYRDVVETLIAAGYDVVWKEHPRAVEPFGPRLAETFPRQFQLLEVPAELPVDVLVAARDWRACVSVYSSTLFYAKYLYGIPAYTFAEQALSCMDKPNRKAFDLTMQHIPDYRELLAEGGAVVSGQRRRG